ncbi:MAG: proline--tRNA ligase, partial [Clostridia bacterium]|nr:proline--tRNA ligase [Clostridia bacterium]
HASQEDLEAYYAKCHKAYERIFARAGIPEVISIASDSGMMGGSISHEFMLLTDIGEDSIVICNDCDYRANMEATENIVDYVRTEPSKDFVKVATPGKQTIEEVAEFLGVEAKDTCKAVVYQQNHDDKYVVLFLRGDYDVNETKLTNYLGCDIHPATITDACGLVAGFIGPVGITENCTVLFDNTLKGVNNLVCGANETDCHCTGLDMDRDLVGAEFHDFAKVKEGSICPKCGKHSLTVSRGIEVGNIFQLGTKYTKSMDMTYMDSEGNMLNPIMGCYGIGVGRLAASICEAHHDDYGPIWPIAIAPWQVHLCAVRSDDEEVKAYADNLYNTLTEKGIEVIYDDRKTVSAGVMFSDADLLGVPFRVVVSPRNMKGGIVEIASRDKSLKTSAPLDSAVDEIVALVKNALANN